jgi:hypothetical protein
MAGSNVGIRGNSATTTSGLEDARHATNTAAGTKIGLDVSEILPLGSADKNGWTTINTTAITYNDGEQIGDEESIAMAASNGGSVLITSVKIQDIISIKPEFFIHFFESAAVTTSNGAAISIPDGATGTDLYQGSIEVCLNDWKTMALNSVGTVWLPNGGLRVQAASDSKNIFFVLEHNGVNSVYTGTDNLKVKFDYIPVN